MSLFGKSNPAPKNTGSIQKERQLLGKNISYSGREAYRLLRTNIAFSLPREEEQEGAKVIGITSTLPGEYKSTTSVNLAYTFAEDGKRVLLLDCDLRLSVMAARMGHKKVKGLSDFLVGAATFESVLRKGMMHPNMDVIFAGSVPPNPSELLGSKRMETTLETIKKNYDYILMDLPPVMAVSDAQVAARYVDGIALVVRQGVVGDAILKETLRRLQYVDARILGIVFTGVSSEGKAYGSGRYYYRRYRQYGESGKYNAYGSYGNYGYSPEQADEKSAQERTGTVDDAE